MSKCVARRSRRAGLLAATVLPLIFAMTGPTCAATILLAADSASRGATVADNKVYLVVSEEVLAAIRAEGHKVFEPDTIPNQYLPRRRRPSISDWVHVFERNIPPSDALITLTVVNRVMRTPTANASSIDLKAEIYLHGRPKPVDVIDQPARQDWPMKSGCFGPCMMRVLSENVQKPAKEFSQAIVLSLRKLSGQR